MAARIIELEAGQAQAPVAGDIDAMKEQMKILEDTLRIVMDTLPVNAKKTLKASSEEGKKIFEGMKKEVQEENKILEGKRAAKK